MTCSDWLTQQNAVTDGGLTIWTHLVSTCLLVETGIRTLYVFQIVAACWPTLFVKRFSSVVCHLAIKDVGFFWSRVVIYQPTKIMLRLGNSRTRWEWYNSNFCHKTSASLFSLLYSCFSFSAVVWASCKISGCVVSCFRWLSSHFSFSLTAFLECCCVMKLSHYLLVEFSKCNTYLGRSCSTLSKFKFPRLGSQAFGIP